MALIDIGSRKQLFLDDHLVESMSDAKKGVNPAVKADHNPVLKAERPWEGNHLAGRKIIYEEDEGLFKMWYDGRQIRVDPERKRVGPWGIQVLGEDEPVSCLATSEDGINWERPNLGLVEFQGSKDNNILPPGSMTPSFKDPRETDAAKRYKHMDWTKDTSAPMLGYLYYSPDGFEWTAYEGNPIIDTAPTVGRWGPTYIMGWDPISENYAAYVENTHHMRAPLGKRIIGRAESPDAIHWSDPETVILQDELDYPDTEFYELTAIAYEGLYVGLLWIFRTTSLTHHPELVVSRDGVHFERNYREPFIFRGGRRLDFDHHSVYMVDVVAHGDKVLCYYNGTNCRSPESMIELGDDATMAIGLATSRLDGFVSVDSGKGWIQRDETDEDLRRVTGRPHLEEVSQGPLSFGQLVTRSFSFSGSRLHLNSTRAPIAAGPGHGEIRVELLTFNHRKIEGFTYDDADPITESGLDQVVSWNGESDLSRLAGQAIKIRFYMKNSKLYSFQFK